MDRFGITPTLMWYTTAEGNRKRIFCKQCLKEGQPWLTENPCSHVLEAEGQSADMQTAKNLLSQVSDDPK